MVPQSRLLVTLATYNEIDNLPQLVECIRQHVAHADILVIDDNSPDGTGEWADRQATEDPHLQCLHRPRKMGLGSATLMGFQHAIDHDYALVLNLDADFSHHPQHIPALVAAVTADEPAVDVAIGSRYIHGGGIEGWPWYRRVMSGCVNLYARILLGLPVKDCSGSFRCYRVALLSELNFDEFYSDGYSYLEEILWRLKRRGATFSETPIVFRDRQYGASKINFREALAAIWVIFRLGLTNWLTPTKSTK